LGVDERGAWQIPDENPGIAQRGKAGPKRKWLKVAGLKRKFGQQLVEDDPAAVHVPIALSGSRDKIAL
jgi:hypothetical protein